MDRLAQGDCGSQAMPGEASAPVTGSADPVVALGDSSPLCDHGDLSAVPEAHREMTLSIVPNQPFRLHLLATIASAIKDPDCRIKATLPTLIKKTWFWISRFKLRAVLRKWPVEPR